MDFGLHLSALQSSVLESVNAHTEIFSHVAFTQIRTIVITEFLEKIMNRHCVLTDTLLAAIRLPDIYAISEEFRLSFSSLSGMKWEPLIDLQSGEIHGHEVSSLLPGGGAMLFFCSVPHGNG